jgi:hypothetical protein
VFFSGKITNSFFSYLVRNGVEPAEIYTLTDLPEEFLKDPTSWLEAARIEQFLRAIDDHLAPRLSTTDLMAQVGHHCKELRAWGVLDSVLRMMQRPQDVFTQPQRFVSYFVSPSPPIANFQKTDVSVSFDLPISYEEYPFVCAFLVAAFESLPTFMGGALAEARWQGTRVHVRWATEQEAFTSGDLQKRVLAPQFVESLIDTLERTEKALEEKSRELEKIRQENTSAAKSQTQDLEKWFRLYRSFNRYSQQILRLQDYFTRSQQLITLLVGQERATPQVQKAMKRVGWDQVALSFPEVVDGLLKDFETEKKGLGAEGSAPKDGSSMKLDINPSLDSRSSHVQNSSGVGARDPGQSWLSHS